MPTLVCIQCAMEAMLSEEPYRPGDESVEEHMREKHPDPVAGLERRAELERLLAAKLNVKVGEAL